MLMNNREATEEIKEETRKYLETMILNDTQ